MKRRISISSKVLIFLIVLYPLLFIWQGLGFGDEGFALANYQQIFDEPESIAGGFVFNWLQYVMGGIWVSLFGDSLGIAGVRFAVVLVGYMTIGFCYLILRPYSKQEYLLSGLLLGLLLNTTFGLHYHILTSLFYVVSVFFLVGGLKRPNILWILFSGFILGMGIFIKLPNLLGFALILGVFFYGRLDGTPARIQVRQTMAFILSYAAAILLAVLTMKLLGHYSLFVDSVKPLLSFGAETKSHHSFIKLMAVLIMDHIVAAVVLILGILAIFIASKILSILKNRYLCYGVTTAFGIVLSLALIYGAPVIGKLTPRYYQYLPGSMPTLLIVGLLYIVLLKYIIEVDNSNNDFRLVSFMALIVLVITPIGAGSGIKAAQYGAWLPIPIVLGYMLGLKEIKASVETTTDSAPSRFSFGLSRKEIALARKPIIACFVVLLLVLCTGITGRIKMLYPIDHPRLKGIFTTRAEAAAVQELLNEMDNHVKEGDYLLTYEYIPTLHFLTKTRPYLYNAWPMELYSPHQLEEALQKATKERQYLPVVVKGKEVETTPGTDSEKRTYAMRAIIDEFLEHNRYSLVWKNSLFEILAPSSI
jgi:hypothetical protein